MDEKVQRSWGGKLALWAFYAFCCYFIWMMVRFLWVVSEIQTPPGTVSRQWLSVLLGAVVLGTVGALLGAIAWYTRPHED